jgi:hypothetical protein
MPGGQAQEPGGWNRVLLKVTHLPGFITELKKAELHFRNEIEDVARTLVYLWHSGSGCA